MWNATEFVVIILAVVALTSLSAMFVRRLTTASGLWWRVVSNSLLIPVGLIASALFVYAKAVSEPQWGEFASFGVPLLLMSSVICLPFTALTSYLILRKFR